MKHDLKESNGHLLYNHETLIQRGYGAFGKEYILAHVPECDEVAGSGARHIQECYRVIHQFDGNRHSRAFKTLDQAQECFNCWTKFVEEMKA